MINLKIVLRSSDVQPFANNIYYLFENSKDNIDTTDFYNLRYFCKRFFDKNYRMYGTKNKKITITVNLNVYDTLLRLFNLNEKYMYSIENNWFLVVFREVLLQLNKQVINLPGINMMQLH